MKYARLIILFILLLFQNEVKAFLYGEHKLIGDSAFKRFIIGNGDCFNFFKGVLCFNQSNQWKLTDKNFPVLYVYEKDFDPVTFGEVNGLSGDHALQPVDLFLELLRLNADQWFNDYPQTIEIRLKKLVMPKILALHRDAISSGSFGGADDIKLTLAQHSYPALAIKDSSHFYISGMKSIEEHLEICLNRFLLSVNGQPGDLEVFMGELVQPRLNGDMVEEKFDMAKIDSFLTRLYGINSIAKYSVLHTVALSTMDLAARLSLGGEDEKSARFRLTVQLAIMFEGYACHFIQDAFAAGHLCVNRSTKFALNNQGTHDYYNHAGQDVVNLLNEHWTSYGDGCLSSSDTNRQNAIRACHQSLVELWDRYKHSLTSGDTLKFLSQEISTMDLNTGTHYIMQNFKALQIIPVPVSKSNVEFRHSHLGPASSVSFGYLFKPFSEGRVGYSWEWNYLGLVKAKCKTTTFYEYKVSLQFLNLALFYNFKEKGLAANFAAGINFYDRVTLLPASWYWNIKAKSIDWSPACTVHFKSIKCNWTPSVRVSCISPLKSRAWEASGGITYYF